MNNAERFACWLNKPEASVILIGAWIAMAAVIWWLTGTWSPL